MPTMRERQASNEGLGEADSSCSRGPATCDTEGPTGWRRRAATTGYRAAGKAEEKALLPAEKRRTGKEVASRPRRAGRSGQCCNNEAPLWNGRRQTKSRWAAGHAGEGTA